MKTMKLKSRALLPALICCLLLFMSGTLPATENQTFKTGLPELTKQELQWQNTHMLRVKKVKLNKLGLERINRWKAQMGMRKIRIDDTDLSAIGSELEVVKGAVSTVETDSTVPSADYPGSVDNSQLKYFPPIRSQGSLNSCGVFSGTYYAMTHMYAMAHNLDAKTGGDAYRFSPKWTYNMVNGGGNNGTWYYWAYEIGQKHGAATWEQFPYDSDYRAWNLDPDTWENALYKRFDQYGYILNTHQDTGIEQVKQMLLNGYVLNIPTYIYSWVWQTIGDDPSTTDDDAFAGKKCVSWVNGTSGYHAMTVVGYNDNIWVDINQNYVVDAGEKGAFRIANSWGTGWGEGGFAWMSYDALKNPSSVSGGPSSGRIYGWYPSRAHWVTSRTGYQPKLIGKFKLHHAKRDHLRITLGTSDINQYTPAATWIPEMIYNQGGAYGFDGTTAAVEGTFVFDFTDLLSSADGLSTWYLGVQDDTAGSEATLSTFTLVDVANGYTVVESLEVPQIADAEQVYAAVDYDPSGGNLAPSAIAEVSATSGIAPFTVTFDGLSSYDSDGSIVSYAWEFGDGASQSGAVAGHTYDQQGTYIATLTVTDNNGATATDSATIEVTAVQQVYVSAVDATPVIETTGTRSQVTVEIMDTHQLPVSGAQVTGYWSGLLSGTVSGVTSEDGRVEWVSDITPDAGTITFTVETLSASGYEYDASMNMASSASITTDSVTNEAPVAVIEASPSLNITSGSSITFSGTNSYDPDGSITAYQWQIGDTLVSPETSFTYTFSAAGTYEVTLTVEDDAGAASQSHVTVNVDALVETAMHVAGIDITIKKMGRNFEATALVTITDNFSTPVIDAVVTGTWSGVVNEDQTAVTNGDGIASFTSSKTKKTGSFIFTVNNVTAAGYVYTAEDNVLTSNSANTP